MERLDQKAIDRISGPAWSGIRTLLASVHAAIIAVSPTAHGELTTIYIKYLSNETGVSPFAVVWVKKSSELTIGLAIPEAEAARRFLESPGINYQGLTAYFRIETGDSLPDDLSELAKAAYENILATASSDPESRPPLS